MKTFRLLATGLAIGVVLAIRPAIAGLGCQATNLAGGALSAENLVCRPDGSIALSVRLSECPFASQARLTWTDEGGGNWASSGCLGRGPNLTCGAPPAAPTVEKRSFKLTVSNRGGRQLFTLGPYVSACSAPKK
jgi:hypothetical protein